LGGKRFFEREATSGILVPTGRRIGGKRWPPRGKNPSRCNTQRGKTKIFLISFGCLRHGQVGVQSNSAAHRFENWRGGRSTLDHRKLIRLTPYPIISFGDDQKGSHQEGRPTMRLGARAAGGRALSVGRRGTLAPRNLYGAFLIQRNERPSPIAIASSFNKKYRDSFLRRANMVFRWF